MQTKKILLVALYCALLAVGSYIRFPLPPVPITLQTMFVMLLGLTTSWSVSLEATLLYLFLGAIGLPVFTGGGGLGALIGPTGGFLFAMVVAAPVISLIVTNPKRRGLGWDIAAVVAAELIIYGIGVPYLKYNRNIGWNTAFKVGMLPFLPGDALKATVAILLAKTFRQRIEDFVSPR
jgi:biotin transport system substrate-specific component